MTGKTTQSVGVYSVSVKSFFGNIKPKTDKELLEKKRKKTLKPIIYPIFESCSKMTEDKFWQAKFMECAQGKFPRGFTYKNNLITFRKANKMHRLELSDSPAEAFIATMEFFNKSVGMMSVEDQKRLKKAEDEKLLEKLQSSKDITWKDIKTEKIKDILICEFIETLANKMCLSYEEKKELITVIKKGFMLKYFTGSNIEMEDGKIKEIDGLICDDQTRHIYIDERFMVRKATKQSFSLGIEKVESKPQIDFLEIWEKYLSSLENKRRKKNLTYSSSHTHNESEDSLSRTTDYSITS